MSEIERALDDIFEVEDDNEEYFIIDDLLDPLEDFDEVDDDDIESEEIDWEEEDRRDGWGEIDWDDDDDDLDDDDDDDLDDDDDDDFA